MERSVRLLNDNLKQFVYDSKLVSIEIRIWGKLDICSWPIQQYYSGAAPKQSRSVTKDNGFILKMKTPMIFF